MEQPKKKEKVKKQPADAGGASTSGGKPAKAEERLADVSRLDIRVGRIRTVKRHPDADSLYVEEVDVGEAAPRQVVSGLVKFIPLEGMQDARVLLVCNLKPANMRGVQSQAMVLAASTADGGKVELVTPPEGAQIGERVTFEGYSGEPDEQLNPKKKIFEQVHPDFTTSADLIATYKGVPFMTSQGPCTVASIQSGNIR